MAIKFSQFVVQTNASALSHIVGYNGADNIQITPADFINSFVPGGPFLPLAGGTMTAAGITIFPDSTFLKFGNLGDASIYHDATDTYFKNFTGDLIIQNNSDDKDINVDVTNAVRLFNSGTIPNEGFIVKRSGSFYDPTTTSGSFGNNDSGSDEGNSTRFGNFSFFSTDTHTKYPPTLEAVWDDSKWTTGSLSPLTKGNIEDMVIYMKGLRPEYKEKSKVKFRVYGRERFPTRTYSTSSQNLTVKFIPSQSQYSVRDALTEDTIVPFSTGSYLSCDGKGNFFRMDLNSFQPERHYRFLYKVVSGSGNTRVEHIVDNDHIFKITR